MPFFHLLRHNELARLFGSGVIDLLVHSFYHRLIFSDFFLQTVRFSEDLQSGALGINTAILHRDNEVSNGLC